MKNFVKNFALKNLIRRINFMEQTQLASPFTSVAIPDTTPEVFVSLRVFAYVYVRRYVNTEVATWQ